MMLLSYQIRLIRYRTVTNQPDRSYPRSGGRYRPLEGSALGFKKTASEFLAL